VPVRHYANHLDVQISISEVDLRFGQNFSEADGDGPAVLSWLVTTPVHLVAFAQTLDGVIARYRETFGPIPGDDSRVAR